MSPTFVDDDGQVRCRWCSISSAFRHYHDTEWGFPVADDDRLFEKICLEGFQSGLSWRTILAKRPRFRAVFHDFNFEQVARFDQQDVAKLLQDEGIIRHRGKIEAAIHNAGCARQLVQEAGSLAAFFWRYEPDAATRAAPQTVSTSAESVVLAKALKQRGWKFVGPTTVYAFMQAMGLVNDHVHSCVIRAQVEAARAVFRRPV